MSKQSSRSAEFKRNAKVVIEEYGECAWCGTEEDLTVDHIIPKALGGSDDIENLQVLCRTHNGRKQDKVIVRRSWVNPKWA